MRSAQRRHRLENRVRKSNSFLVVKILIVPVILLLVFLFFKISTKYWNGTDKIAYAYRLTSGDIAVTVDDPKLNEETTLIIPGDTQVDVAGNYGTFRFKNVWQLSVNEKLGGALISRTLTKDFMFPVFLWSDSDAVSLKESDFTGIIKFVFSPKATNIPIGDRASMALFALQVKSIDKTEINLGQSKFLQKASLNDGQPGYIQNGPVSQRLTIFFSDNDFGDENIKVGIIDATGSFGVAENVGQIIQVLGGKVVSIDKKPQPENNDCTVSGKNSNVVSKVSNIFGCKRIGNVGSFDLEIDLGTAFAKRF